MSITKLLDANASLEILCPSKFFSLNSIFWVIFQITQSKKRCSDGQCILSDEDFGQLKKKKLMLEIELLELDKNTKTERCNLELKNLQVQIKVGQARARFLEVATDILEQNPEYLCQICKIEP